MRYIVNIVINEGISTQFKNTSDTKTETGSSLTKYGMVSTELNKKKKKAKVN